ncbi:MAG: organic hydroperoxide resistance protein [Janthinobacterium lividum]
MKTLYTAVATATGGRTGHVESTDGLLTVDLALPKEMGGSAGTGTNPEQLFAGGYAACFGSALDYLAKQRKIETGTVSVTAQVGIGPNDTGSFSLSAALDIIIPALSQSDAEALAADAHQVCPYSNAVKGNIDVALTVHGGQ